MLKLTTLLPQLETKALHTAQVTMGFTGGGLSSVKYCQIADILLAANITITENLIPLPRPLNSSRKWLHSAACCCRLLFGSSKEESIPGKSAVLYECETTWRYSLILVSKQL